MVKAKLFYYIFDNKNRFDNIHEVEEFITQIGEDRLVWITCSAGASTNQLYTVFYRE